MSKTLFARPLLQAVLFFLLATVAGLAQANNAYLERCLAGYVQSAACQQTIANFWRHNDEMERAALNTGLEPALIRAVAAVESRYNSRARSPVGATGVMQIMPATGKQLGVYDSAGLYHAPTNLTAGATYLRKMYMEFGDWRLAIAAYNAGPGAVRKYGFKIPPYRETQNYVVSVLRFYTLFKEAEQKVLSKRYAYNNLGR